MKWGIIILAVILIMGTILDLYFSISVRTFYLTMLHYPDIIERDDDDSEARAAVYQTPNKDINVT